MQFLFQMRLGFYSFLLHFISLYFLIMQRLFRHFMFVIIHVNAFSSLGHYSLFNFNIIFFPILFIRFLTLIFCFHFKLLQMYATELRFAFPFDDCMLCNCAFYYLSKINWKPATCLHLFFYKFYASYIV